MGKIITLGEIMLRLSTEVGTRIQQTEQFQAHFGGSEANVAVSLANFGHDVSFASKIPAHALGQAVVARLRSQQVAVNQLLFGGERLGTYYVETGVGQRAPSVIYDRAHSAFAQMKTLEWDMASFFEGVELFHVSGITPALSEDWQQMTLALVRLAKEKQCKVSFDINYRAKLWTQKEAGAFIRQILPEVDYCSAGKLDALHFLGIPEQAETVQEPFGYYQAMHEQFPNIQVFYATKRVVHSANAHQLLGMLWQAGAFYTSKWQEMPMIVDRVGGGDAYAAGVLHGLLQQWSGQEIVDFATAASALKHTVSGDVNPFCEQEVRAFLAAASGKIIR